MKARELQILVKFTWHWEAIILVCTAPDLDTIKSKTNSVITVWCQLTIMLADLMNFLNGDLTLVPKWQGHKVCKPQISQRAPSWPLMPL